MTLIKDLIDIPESIQKGDFVLRLAEDINRPEVVLDNYVVTPELAECFDAALTFIGSSVQNRTSKASYLHGSFGSGKSHFMAVLHLILQGNPAARGIPELAPVIQKHNEWLAGKKFLLVPYHMIGAHDMESGVLGNYVEFMRQTHPNSPTPPVYISASIIKEANAERASYGDDAFFKRINEAQTISGGDGWGDIAAAWTPESYEAAAAASPESEEHLRLLSTLLDTVASSQAEVVSNKGGKFVRFDIGLSFISQHAKSAGYDALILFLDELILWLAMNSADLGFVKGEAAKLTNLVEAQSSERPIPLISFVARQRDLRELVGDHVPGAEKLSFSDSLDWQGGRFDTITLEDRNLPAIAEKRVLRVRDENAKYEMDAAFEKTVRMKDSVMNILLTQEGNQQMFRQVYPFSPALVQTLIAVSSVLQRERTALKVMMQLLVDHRETLELGEVIPVGDLFDVVAHGEEAFSPDMAVHFDNARKLYHQTLLPVLEKDRGVRREEVEKLPFNDPARTAFRNDDRLIKTLLLSALVPEVESLRGLTADKLAALNHGTIKSPIPGKEAGQVLQRVQKWVSSGAGDIRIGDEANPTISVQLSGVDTSAIIEQARGKEDNQGNRIRRVRQMLFEQLQINGEGKFEQYRDFNWRNTKRSCSVLFSNIRELPTASLENTDSDWKVVIDFPFDDAGHGPKDDLSKLQEFAQSHPGGSKTLCWVPSFFSQDSLKDLGTLVALEHILTGERFGQFTSHLSPQDRQSAKSILESQRNQLTHRVRNHLDAAYGLNSVIKGSLDTVHDIEPNEHFVSLATGFNPQPPVAANLEGALDHLLSQALEHEFPAAPFFEAEARSNSLKKVYQCILPATQVADGRLEIDKTQRAMVRQLANPLLVGELGVDKTHFVLGQHWKNHFMKKSAGAGEAVTVGQLRSWIDDPKPMGLPKEAQNLIILLYAAQTSQTLYLHGGIYDDATVASVPDDCELRKDKLPASSEWEAAITRAANLFGVPAAKLLSASNVNNLASQCQQKAIAAKQGCHEYVAELTKRLTEFGLTGDCDRLQTAKATQVLAEQLSAGDMLGVISRLANATIATSETAMGECMTHGGSWASVLRTGAWDTFGLVRGVPQEHQAAAQQILNKVKGALAADEHADQLGAALKVASSESMRLLTKAIDKPAPSGGDGGVSNGGGDKPAPKPLPPSKPHPKPGRTVVGKGELSDVDMAAAIKELDEVMKTMQSGQKASVSMSWVITEGGEE